MAVVGVGVHHPGDLALLALAGQAEETSKSELVLAM